MRWIVFLWLACQLAVGVVANGQELSPSEANRVPVPTPRNVRVAKQDGRLQISWDGTAIQKVTAYEVFEKPADGGPVKLGTVELGKVDKPLAHAGKDLPRFTFEAAVPDAPADYFVVAKDYRDNRSRPSQPATFPASKE
jgi:hypothetical protein